MKILKLGLVGLAVLAVIALMSPKEPSGRAADVRPILKPVPAAPIHYEPVDVRPFVPDVADDDYWDDEDTTPVVHKSRWHSTWYAAKAEADRTGRPVFVELRTTPCVYCDQVDRAIADLSVDTELNKFVCLKADTTKDPENLAAQLGVTRFPSLIVAKPDGTYVAFRQGSCDAATVRADLAKAFQGVASNSVPPCGCGCMTTGQCKCKNCCERTADPNWSPTSVSANCPNGNCTTYGAVTTSSVRIGRRTGRFFGRGRCSSASASTCSGCQSSGGGCRSCGR